MTIQDPTNDAELVHGAPDVVSAAAYIEEIKQQVRDDVLDEAISAVIAIANANKSWHQEAHYAHKRAVAMAIDAIRGLKRL